MRSAELKRFPLLARLADGERRLLAERLEAFEVDPGTVLFEEGDPAEGLVLVAEGRVRLASTRTPQSVELGAGSSLGGLSLAAQGTREARAETTSRTRLLVLHRAVYEQLVAEAPRAACKLLEAVLADTGELLREGLDAFVGASVDRAALSD